MFTVFLSVHLGATSQTLTLYFKAVEVVPKGLAQQNTVILTLMNFLRYVLFGLK